MDFSGGSVNFFVKKLLNRDHSATYTIERFEYNGISYTDSELNSLIIDEESIRDYVIALYEKSAQLNLHCKN